MQPGTLRSLGKLSCAALTGLAAGTLLERRRGLPTESQLTKLPGLPVFGTVSAATPLQSPADGAMVPAGAGDSRVMPKSDAEKKLRTRMTEIMKFGFPGRDNVRSYRYV
jgi:hypothetical protein